MCNFSTDEFDKCPKDLQTFTISFISYEVKFRKFDKIEKKIEKFEKI